jgi:hypothetical protein
LAPAKDNLLSDSGCELTSDGFDALLTI